MKENKALRWVKASDREPANDHKKDLYIRYDSDCAHIWRFFSGYFQRKDINGEWGRNQVCRISADNIEWLEEYTPDQPGIDREGGMPEEKVYRWVKASERLPDGPRNENSKVIVRPINNSDLAVVTFAWSADPNETRWYDTRYYFEDTEWLEEIPAQIVRPAKETLPTEPSGERSGVNAQGEVPVDWNIIQPFEAHEKLAPFISDMAHTGSIPSGSAWTSFLWELNQVCFSLSSIKGERDEEVEKWKKEVLRLECADIKLEESRKYSSALFTITKDQQVQIEALTTERDLFKKQSESHFKAWEEATAIIEGKNIEIAELKGALRDYVKTAGRMLDKWAEGDKEVKASLWKQLHALELPTRELLDKYPKKEEGNEKG